MFAFSSKIDEHKKHQYVKIHYFIAQSKQAVRADMSF